ncbi:hypothetical protein SARC_06756, partial [Sphaeroforma arctica JP610]
DALPADCVFAGTGSAHAAALSKIINVRATKSLSKYSDKLDMSIIRRNYITRTAVYVLHIDEVNIRPTNNYTNKTGSLGPAHNNPDMLTNHMQVFVTSALSGPKMSLALMARPVVKQTGEELLAYSTEAIAKSQEANAMNCPVIFDGRSVNRKAMRLLVLQNTDPEPPGRRSALPQQRLPTSVNVNGLELFTVFCLILIVKCIRKQSRS